MLACSPKLIINLTEHIKRDHPGFSVQSASLGATSSKGGEGEDNPERDDPTNSEQIDAEPKHELKHDNKN